MTCSNQLEILDGASEAQLTKIALTSSAPVLIKGAISDWPAVFAGKESTHALQQYLLQFDTQKPMLAFEADSSANGRIFYNNDFTGMNFDKPWYLLEEFFNKLNSFEEQSANPALYMGSTNAEKWLPGFTSENSLGLPIEDKIVNVWMGNQSNVSAHMDFPDNFACCIAGKRTFTLFPPEQLENLYIGPLDNTPAGPAISLVDHNNPDFEQFPKYKVALEAAINVELEPGDILFVPSMWWHQVNAHDDFNVLVNYWWKKLPRYIPSAMDALTYALMTIKDLPVEQRKAWQVWFNHFVFEQGDISHIPEHARGNLNEIDQVQAKKMRAYLLNVLNR